MLQEVLKKIREINDLERLEFGCEYSFYDTKYPRITISWLNWNESDIPDREHKVDIKIIGLPIHLEHLLRTIDYCSVKIDEVKEKNLGCKIEIKDSAFIYDLTKSVEQNLTDNPELLNIVTKLLNISKYIIYKIKWI